MHNGYTERSEWRFHDVTPCGVASAGSGCRIITSNRCPQHSAMDEPIAPGTTRRLLSPLFPALMRTKKIRNTKPARGWEDLIPFIRCIMKKTNRRQQIGLIFWNKGEATRPRRYDTLIAEFSGEDEVEKGKRIAKWRFSQMWQCNQTQLCISVRKIETEEAMAYFQNKRSPWFERMSEARQWLEEQEENRLQSKNEMGFWGEAHGQGENYRGPANSFTSWRGAIARLTSKQKGFVNAWYVRWRALYFQICCGLLMDASCFQHKINSGVGRKLFRHTSSSRRTDLTIIIIIIIIMVY